MRNVNVKTSFDTVFSNAVNVVLPGDNRHAVFVDAALVEALPAVVFPSQKLDLKSRLNELWGSLKNQASFKDAKRLELSAVDAANLEVIASGGAPVILESAGEPDSQKRRDARADRVPSKADRTPELNALAARMAALGIR